MRNTDFHKTILLTKIIASPLGDLLACADESGICMLEFADSKSLEKELREVSKFLKKEYRTGDSLLLTQLENELNEYFQNKRKNFEVPLLPVGTDFQKKVWQSLLTIPYGSTRTYLQQASTLGVPKSVRAVANANGQNKMSIIIPCHRVIGSNGKLTGYGGGIWRKQKLLEIENSILF